MDISPANEWDGKFLPPLTESSFELASRTGKTITSVVADAGYDSMENVSYLMEKNITPYIAENPRGRKNAIVRGEIFITPEGRFLCKCGVELCYWGREKKRKRIKFRCGLWRKKGEGCLFKSVCFRFGYGPTFYLKEEQEVSDALRAIRMSKSFKRVYKTRSAIERLFSILKGRHALGV